MGFKKLRKQYKSSSPYVGNWLKWMKRKIKGEPKEITRKDLLTPLSEFEADRGITKTRDDMQ